MSISYSELVTDVLKNLEMNSLVSNSSQISRFKVVENLNAAQRDILKMFPLETMDNAKKTVKGDLSAGVSSIQWPSDYMRLVKLWLDYGAEICNVNPGKEAIPAQNQTLHPNSLDKRPTVQFPCYEIIEGGFEIRPVPTADQTNGFRLRYVYMLPDISSNQDSLLRTDLKDALVFRATEYCAIVDGYRMDLADKYGKLFLEQLQSYMV